MMQTLWRHGYVFLIAWVLYNLVAVDYVSFSETYEQEEANIPQLESSIARKKNELKQVENYVKDVESAREKIEKVAQGIEQLQKQLPTEAADSENLDIISNISTKLNLKSVQLSPQDEQLMDFYIIKRYQLKAQGTFLQFLMFFEKLAAEERLFNIDQFKLIKNDEKQKGRFQMINAEIVISSFRVNPNYKEDSGVESIDRQFEQPQKTNNAGKNDKYDATET